MDQVTKQTYSRTLYVEAHRLDFAWKIGSQCHIQEEESGLPTCTVLWCSESFKISFLFFQVEFLVSNVWLLELNRCPRVHSVHPSSMLHICGQVKKNTCKAHMYSLYRACILRRLWSPGIDSKEWIPPAYVCLAGRSDNPIPTRFQASIDCLNIPAQCAMHTPLISAVMNTWGWVLKKSSLARLAQLNYS